MCAENDARLTDALSQLAHNQMRAWDEKQSTKRNFFVCFLPLNLLLRSTLYVKRLLNISEICQEPFDSYRKDKTYMGQPFLHKQNGASKTQVVLTLYVMTTLVLQRRRQIKRVRV